MKKFTVCLLISILLHLGMFAAFPFFEFKPKERESIYVSIEPIPAKMVESVGPVVTPESASRPVKTAKPDETVKPKEKLENKAEPEVAPVVAPEKEPEKSVKEVEQAQAVEPDVVHTESEATMLSSVDEVVALPASGEEAFPTAEVNPVIAEESSMESHEDSISISTETAAAELTPVLTDNETASEETAPEEEEAEEVLPRDGRADVVIVQTFVGDRIQGQIEFKGKGRRLVNSPSAPDFKLSNNTTVTVEFKIDKYGATYDIVIPPIAKDIETMLRDIVRKMRFSAVLYDEPDQASMKITLTVR